MKTRRGVRELGPACSTYQGTRHYRDAGAPVHHFGGARISMNSVAIGHVSAGKPFVSLQEERERVWKGAQIPIK